MSVQDYINAVDTTKPIDPPATKTAPKPTSASVRANFTALKNALQAMLDGMSSADNNISTKNVITQNTTIAADTSYIVLSYMTVSVGVTLINNGQMRIML